MPDVRAVVASGDPELRARIIEILRDTGVEVVREAPNGELALLACTTEEVDLVFLEEDLPEMSGSSVAEVLGDMDRPVRAVVIHRGRPPSDIPRAVDASRPEFPEALL